MVKRRVAKAIEDYEKSRANSDNAGGSGSGNAGGTVNVQEQVFEICKCAEEDKVMFAASTFEGRALTWWNRNVMDIQEKDKNRSQIDKTKHENGKSA
ncbi:hypothetical protein Tco_1177534, partial [Tanacetum coccineum]